MRVVRASAWRLITLVIIITAICSWRLASVGLEAQVQQQRNQRQEEEASAPALSDERLDDRHRGEEEDDATKEGDPVPANNTDDNSNEAGTWPPTQMLEDLIPSDAKGNLPTQKRLVVAATNHGMVEFADNFANGLVHLGVTNFVLVPLDRAAHRVLREAYPRHTVPPVPGLDVVAGGAAYGTEAFKKINGSKPSFLRPFLEQGFAVYYNDIDMVWRRNAWEELDAMTKEAVPPSRQITTVLWPDNLGLCACMMYLLPTQENIKFIMQWETGIRQSARYKHDQWVFQEVAKRLELGDTDKNPHVLTVGPRTDTFPNGQMFFANAGGHDEKEDEARRAKAVVVHNNWIKGKDKKLERFEKHGLWNPSGKVSTPS